MSVHNIKREWMDRPTDVYIGRASSQHDGYFGNPFGTKGGIQHCATVEEAIDRFREYAKDRMYRDPEYRMRVLSLRGKRLFCFCTPGPCHGRVLEELARREALWVEAHCEGYEGSFSAGVAGTEEYAVRLTEGA